MTAQIGRPHQPCVFTMGGGIAHGIHAAVSMKLPLQFHVGFGDRDLDLHKTNPLYLLDFLRSPEVRDTPVMLLHCYPFEREAGYLAHAFENVYLDVGLAVNFTGSRSRDLVARSFELAPFTKIFYSSDASARPNFTTSERDCGATQ